MKLLNVRQFFLNTILNFKMKGHISVLEINCRQESIIAVYFNKNSCRNNYNVVSILYYLSLMYLAKVLKKE